MQQTHDLDELNQLMYDDINNNCLLLSKNQTVQVAPPQSPYAPQQNYGIVMHDESSKEDFCMTRQHHTSETKTQSRLHSISDDTAHHEQEAAVINPGDDNSRATQLATNSKLRPTASVFKLENSSKFFANDLQTFDQLHINPNYQPQQQKPVGEENEMRLLSPIKFAKKNNNAYIQQPSLGNVK